jgi:hypothetical protein
MLEYFYKGDVSIDSKVGTSQNPIDLESPPQVPTLNPQIPQTSFHWGRPSVGGQGLFSNQGNNVAPNPIHNSVQNPVYAAPSFSFGYAPVVSQNQGANQSSFHTSSIMSYASITTSPSYPQSNFAGSFVPQNEPFVDAPPTPVIPPPDPKNLVTLAAIYVVAEKYDVQPLKLLAHTKYEAILPSAWNTEHFIESLELIYDGIPEMSDPDSLRDLAIKTAAMHAKELMDRGEFMTLCKERGDFVTDVFRASLPQSQVAAADAAVGSGIPRCRINSSHAVLGIFASRTYGGPATQRYKCSVCNTFID